MAPHDNLRVTAVLGPTNTGKTHLAVERMVAHSSGMIGFPLRLLAREVYDRVVAMKGPERVALITGEERIVPKDARWFLCTAESMPVDRDVAFVALDEAQLGADAERGHVFTDRLLHARGREETMILGSAALKPVVRALIPRAEIVERPRFSDLSYAGAKKISRLPRRSAIVAFSAEEVYAVAEMLRRLRGGAAVVMGALSPRTRNAQVAMFQAGEVDYLVATDAIGMGLNMDVAHVAFAGLHKFDGKRRRRLTVSEMAQIAGRAGRHQRDGTFGAVTEEGPDAFLPEEVLAIEEHRFPALDWLYWRNGRPDLSTVDTLLASLSEPPDHERLRAAPEALDLAVARRLSADPKVRAQARGQVERFWAVCGIPDFQKLGAEPHARFVGRVFDHLSTGYLPHQWFADEVARLDRVDGDVETIAGRVAAIRTWAYIAQRKGWLADPEHWAARTSAVEERLSDALHTSLTQRFVDKRTSVLMKQIGAGAGALPVEIGAEGEVTIDTHSIGRLDGFRFVVAPDARAADKRLLLSTAEKQLSKERDARGAALIGDEDQAFALNAEGVITWQGHAVGRLARGRSAGRPVVMLNDALDCLAAAVRKAANARLQRWVDDAVAAQLPVVARLATMASDPAATGALRSVARAIEAGAGMTQRLPIRSAVEALSPEERQRLRKAGVTIGALDLFDPRTMKARAYQWRAALLQAAGQPLKGVPPGGASVLPRGAPGAVLMAGYRPLGAQAVRIDLVERIARAAHDGRKGRGAFTPDPALATSMGLEPATIARLMTELGFRALSEGRWAWRGRPPAKTVQPRSDNAFAALSELTFG
ncbi:helicase-related protein [Sphingomonas sp.]|jgi:ATP-dependent RNA helicase SUPV3L1/SUV3|uniref:helicase-related protein n=1 Tax=Sphingomonas sp. TaxID=28214 RepID=UPI002602C11E|nr:helicase-related protein [Sphingomonas sp.]MDF2493497.1 helicase [Sphingomonas sp.]